jgi:hypothetical protein
VSSGSKSGTSAGPGASTVAFDALLAKELAALVAVSKEAGAPVQAATELLQKAFVAQRAVVVTLAACKPPGAPGLQKLLAPLGAVLAESAFLWPPRLRWRRCSARS